VKTIFANFKYMLLERRERMILGLETGNDVLKNTIDH
jgi:hypothetical protein